MTDVQTDLKRTEIKNITAILNTMWVSVSHHNFLTRASPFLQSLGRCLESVWPCEVCVCYEHMNVHRSVVQRVFDSAVSPESDLTRSCGSQRTSDKSCARERRALNIIHCCYNNKFSKHVQSPFLCVRPPLCPNHVSSRAPLFLSCRFWVGAVLMLWHFWASGSELLKCSFFLFRCKYVVWGAGAEHCAVSMLKWA